MTFEDLTVKISDFNWFKFTQRLYEKIGVEPELKPTDDVIVNDLPYLVELSKILKNADNDLLRNYLGWRFVQNNGFLTTRQFRQNEFEFNQVVAGVEKQEDMSKRCLNFVLEATPTLVGRTYIEKWFSAEEQKASKEIINQVLEAFKNVVDQKDWMDQVTKNRSREKIEKFTINAAYPDWIKDDNEIKKIFNFVSSAIT